METGIKYLKIYLNKAYWTDIVINQKSMSFPFTASNVCADGDGDDANCTADTNFPLNVSAAMMCKTHLQYDQHSSEEELEVINGPSSMAVAEATSGLITTDLSVRGSSSLISERGSSSVDFDELCGESSTLKRSSSTLIERRKRSMAHSSDDDVSSSIQYLLNSPPNRDYIN